MSSTGLRMSWLNCNWKRLRSSFLLRLILFWPSNIFIWTKEHTHTHTHTWVISPKLMVALFVVNVRCFRTEVRSPVALPLVRITTALWCSKCSCASCKATEFLLQGPWIYTVCLKTIFCLQITVNLKIVFLLGDCDVAGVGALPWCQCYTQSLLFRSRSGGFFAHYIWIEAFLVCF